MIKFEMNGETSIYNFLDTQWVVTYHNYIYVINILVYNLTEYSYIITM